jgi:hypothetical protein
VRETIVVYIDSEGVDSMVKHILDGSLKQHKPSLTVGAATHPIPVLDRTGQPHHTVITPMPYNG